MIKKLTIDPYPDPDSHLLGRDAGRSAALMLQDIVSADKQQNITGVIIKVRAYTDASFWDALRVSFINNQVGRLCIKVKVSPPCDSTGLKYNESDIWANIESVYNKYGMRCLINFAKYPYISKRLFETYSLVPLKYTRTTRLLKRSPTEVKHSTFTMRLTKLYQLGFILRRYNKLKEGCREYSWSNPFAKAPDRESPKINIRT